MELKALQQELGQTHYSGRVGRMIALGRQARTDPAAHALIRQLHGGDAFDRRMALYACFTLRDGELVRQGTQDESRLVRGLSYALVAMSCDDATAFGLLQEAYAQRREKRLLRTLAQERRRGVMDLYVDWLLPQVGIREVVDLIPGCTPAAIERHLPLALTQPSKLFWQRLATAAPAVMVRVLLDRLAPFRDEPDPVTRQLINQYLLPMATSDARATLPLLAELCRRKIFAHDGVWRALARRLPDEALDLMHAQGVPVATGLVARVLQQLTPDRLRLIIERHPHAVGDFDRALPQLGAAQRAALVAAWARTFTPPSWGLLLLADLKDAAQREQAYARWSTSAQSKDGDIPLAKVDLLPQDLQEREARRHLHQVVALATRTHARIPYAQYLPWDEAKGVLQTLLGHPEGSMRGAVLTVLLRIPGRRLSQPALADAALELVLARKNEQDPVRQAMATALAQWPREAWRVAHTAAVAQIIRAGLDASDLSHGTAQALESLLLRTFRLDPAWGATWLETLVRERGQIYNAAIGEGMTDDEVRAAGPSLLRLATAWMGSERHPAILTLAQSLGPRLPLVDGFVALLVKLIHVTRWPQYAHQAMGVLSKADRPTFLAELPKVAAARHAAAEYTYVFQLAHFSQGEQPEALIAEVEKIALGMSQLGLPGALSWLRSWAIQRFNGLLAELLRRDESIGLLPDVKDFLSHHRQDLLTPYLGGKVIHGRYATGHTSWVLRFERDFYRWSREQNGHYKRSMESLCGETDRDTPTMIWALTTMAKLAYVRLDSLTHYVEDRRPVIVDKTLRLLARCDQGEGVPTLIRCLDDDRGRIAIYGLRRAVADMPLQRAFEVLRAVPLKKVTIAKETVRLLGELRHEQAFLTLLALDKPTLHRDVRLALQRALWERLDREETWQVFERSIAGPDWILANRLGDIPADKLTEKSDARLSGLLARVLDRPEIDARLDLLQRAAGMAVKDRGRVFLMAASRRLSSVHDDEVRAATMAIVERSDEGDMERLEQMLTDLVTYRRGLRVAVDTLLAVPVKSRAVYRQAAAAAMRVASRDPALAELEVRAAFATLSTAALCQQLATMSDAGRLSFSALAAAQGALGLVPAEDLDGLITALRACASPGAREIALWALSRDAGPDRGWTPERRASLAQMQRDPAACVRGPAQFVFPPVELPAPPAAPATAPAGPVVGPAAGQAR